jgi:hypothetical protein
MSMAFLIVVPAFQLAIIVGVVPTDGKYDVFI